MPQSTPTGYLYTENNVTIIVFFFLGNHAFSIVCGKKCYESFSISFKDVFAEIKELIADSAINIDGEIIKLDFFLGGDYKVYQNMKFKKCVKALYSSWAGEKMTSN